MNLDWPPIGENEAGSEYAQYSEVYDVLFQGQGEDIGYYVNAAQSMLPDGGSILELGTGTGRLTEPLLDAGFSVTGVDPSAPMLARASQRLAHFADRVRLIECTAQSMQIPGRFPLAVAPFAMVSHLYTDAERLAVFRRVHAQLEPGGVFLFDDMPAWLAGVTDGSQLEHFRTGHDPESGMAVRLLTNSMEVAGEPFTVRYDFVDWINSDNEVARRMIVRVRFRNISLADELALLEEAGFASVEMFGGFDGRPFSADEFSANSRLIFRCHKA